MRQSHHAQLDEPGPALDLETASGPSRRALLATSGVAAAAIAPLAAVVPSAEAAVSYRTRPYTKTAVPSGPALHLMNRLGCGYSPATYAQMRRAGTAEKWFSQQLQHTKIAESATARALVGWYPALAHSPARQWDDQRTDRRGSWEYARDLANLSTMRRIYSNRQVFETMVDFWSNHLHVPASGGEFFVHRYSYDQVIRRHALGRFDQLLVAATLHPAMQLYLDNWRSERNAPNENHGRELLELHTVGRTSGYTEAMVVDSAKILSGYTIDVNKTWDCYYDSSRHTTGPVRVLGFQSANASSDGQELVRNYLLYLAHHPATARTIATKIALSFVSDAPSTALINHLAKVFRDSGTDIKATLRALVAHPEFKSSAGKKVRTPTEDLVATARALQIRAFTPTGPESFGHAACWVPQSMLLYEWPRPDGPPAHGSAWSSATRMLSSFQMHWDLAGGWYPSKNVTYRAPDSWLPTSRIRLDSYVDHLCRVLLGRKSTSRLLEAVVIATGYQPGTVVTRSHPLAKWLFVRVLAALLDSPEHMKR